MHRCTPHDIWCRDAAADAAHPSDNVWCQPRLSVCFRFTPPPLISTPGPAWSGYDARCRVLWFRQQSGTIRPSVRPGSGVLLYCESGQFRTSLRATRVRVIATSSCWMLIGSLRFISCLNHFQWPRDHVLPSSLKINSACRPPCSQYVCIRLLIPAHGHIHAHDAGDIVFGWARPTA